MIAWWGWLLLWVGLGLALLAMFALFAWRLFRKFLGLVDDLADLTDRLEVLDSAVELTAAPTPALAVLTDTQHVREREKTRAAHRQRLRDERRERRMTRAFIIGSVDVTSSAWPAAWSTRSRTARKAGR